MSRRDLALEELTSEFPNVSARVVVAVFLGYLRTCSSLTDAVTATRMRILDAISV